ncbi:hypothetical protein JHK85_001435 [Glycine max]|nr:hypothetical protein JHK85_001435 [Glycine max]
MSRLSEHQEQKCYSFPCFLSLPPSPLLLRTVISNFDLVGAAAESGDDEFTVKLRYLFELSATETDVAFGKWFGLRYIDTLLDHSKSMFQTLLLLYSYGRGRDAPDGRFSSLIFGTNLTDVIITGYNGTIDGQGCYWWDKFHKGELKLTRPYMIEIMFSDHIQISNLTLINSPSWFVHPIYTSDIIIQGLTILAPVDSPNTDGIDPDSETEKAQSSLPSHRRVLSTERSPDHNPRNPFENSNIDKGKKFTENSAAHWDMVHPILDQSFFLDNTHKMRLKEEFKIEPWTFEQHVGEAVIIPSGCPYQIRNPKCCVHVELEFVSPENVSECIQLIDEVRLLPEDHKAKVEKLEELITYLLLLMITPFHLILFFWKARFINKEPLVSIADLTLFIYKELVVNVHYMECFGSFAPIRELYLRRPFDSFSTSRLDSLLEEKANQGVQIYVLLYKEVSLALKINSLYSMRRLLKIHENVRVLCYLDHFAARVYLWSHHEKLVIIDYKICYIGGLDLCFG